MNLCRLLLALSLSAWIAIGATRPADVQRWENAVVTLEVSAKQYNYLQPWSRGTQSVIKPGVVLAPRTLLTTAHGLADRTVVRTRAGGRGTWFDARVTWIDYPANLALLTVDDEEFWRDRQPVSLSPAIPEEAGLRVVRWRGGSLELRRAEYNRFTVSNPTGGGAAHAVLEINAEVSGIGWGEPVVSDTQVIGLVFAQRGNVCHVLPAPFIQSILDAREQGAFRGLGYFDFTWQPTENPDLLRYLRVPDTGHGVVIIHVPQFSPTAALLRPRDVILRVDGFDIDPSGDYRDPLYGHLMLENLSTRQRWAGDRIPLKIWRDGAPLEVEYTLPPLRQAARLVPEDPADHPPEYLIAGGLVFQPLTRNFLESWGQDWERSAPFRLAYFRNEEPTQERPARVILSSVLPDPINLGYQDVRTLVLEQVNGEAVSTLAELRHALTRPQEGFHLFEFLAGESLQRIVLDAAQIETANSRILQRYGIQASAQIH